MSLTQKQASLIHIAKGQLGLTDEDYRAILSSVAGVQSATQLDNRGFDRLMERFAELGFKSTSRRKPIGTRSGMATNAQVAIIRNLWGQFTNGEGDDTTLGKWLEGRFKVSAVRFLTAELAPKAIAALKNMCARTQPKA